MPAEAIEAIREIDHRALRLEPQPRRLYPQGEMLCHALGFVDFDNIGRSGIEAYYQDELAGEPALHRTASRRFTRVLMTQHCRVPISF